MWPLLQRRAPRTRIKRRRLEGETAVVATHVREVQPTRACRRERAFVSFMQGGERRDDDGARVDCPPDNGLGEARKADPDPRTSQKEEVQGPVERLT